MREPNGCGTRRQSGICLALLVLVGVFTASCALLEGSSEGVAAEPEDTDIEAASAPQAPAESQSDAELDTEAELVSEPDEVIWVALAGAAEWDQPGYIHRSEDGVNWTTMEHDLSPGVLIHDEERFTAFATHERLTSVLHSTDGHDWEIASEVPGRIEDAAYGGGHYVAIGFDDGSNHMIFGSEDGLDWHRQASLAEALSVDAGEVESFGLLPISIAHGDDGFYVLVVSCGASTWCTATHLLRSEDGIDWETMGSSLSDEGVPDAQYQYLTLGAGDGYAATGFLYATGVRHILRYIAGEWEPMEPQPQGISVSWLSSSGSTWFSTSSSSIDDVSTVIMSKDLISWVPVAKLEGGVRAVVVAGPLDADAIEPLSEFDLTEDDPDPAEAAESTCPDSDAIEAAVGQQIDLSVSDGFIDITCIGTWGVAITDVDLMMYEALRVYFQMVDDEPQYVIAGSSLTCDEVGIPEGDPARELCVNA